MTAACTGSTQGHEESDEGQSDEGHEVNHSLIDSDHGRRERDEEGRTTCTSSNQGHEENDEGQSHEGHWKK